MIFCIHKCFIIYELQDKVPDLLTEVKWLSEWDTILKQMHLTLEHLAATLPAQEAPSTTQRKQLSVLPLLYSALSSPQTPSVHPLGFLPGVIYHLPCLCLSLSLTHLPKQFGARPLDEGLPAHLRAPHLNLHHLIMIIYHDPQVLPVQFLCDKSIWNLGSCKYLLLMW